MNTAYKKRLFVKGAKKVSEVIHTYNGEIIPSGKAYRYKKKGKNVSTVRSTKIINTIDAELTDSEVEYGPGEIFNLSCSIISSFCVSIDEAFAKDKEFENDSSGRTFIKDWNYKYDQNEINKRLMAVARDIKHFFKIPLSQIYFDCNYSLDKKKTKRILFSMLSKQSDIDRFDKYVIEYNNSIINKTAVPLMPSVSDN